MKNLIIGFAITATIFAACNNGGNETTKNDSGTAVIQAADTIANPTATATAVTMKDIVAVYLQMKNAFASDNDKDAADAGNKLVTTFASFDTSRLSAEQLKTYNDITDDAKEHAEHIGANAGNIAHQREHFAMLGKDMYDLVKAFGGGQALYYDYCPMYNKGKDGYWISEVKDIKNPYLGKAMPTCGSVKEELK